MMNRENRNTIQKNYSLFILHSLDSELRRILRKYLNEVCIGHAEASGNEGIFSYKRTINNFLNIYNAKYEIKKKGIIGELLSHLIIREYFSDKYTVTSFLFNMENKGMTNGFDIILLSKVDHEI